ncbi:MAG: hypothetical protein QM784_03995 [Polyangiaceae bacterium]
MSSGEFPRAVVHGYAGLPISVKWAEKEWSPDADGVTGPAHDVIVEVSCNDPTKTIAVRRFFLRMESGQPRLPSDHGNVPSIREGLKRLYIELVFRTASPSLIIRDDSRLDAEGVALFEVTV